MSYKDQYSKPCHGAKQKLEKKNSASEKIKEKTTLLESPTYREILISVSSITALMKRS